MVRFPFGLAPHDRTAPDRVQRARRARTPLLVAWSLGLAACGGGVEEELPPNVVLITLDTLRADHVGCYGYFRDTTPALDELAEQCWIFERCLAPIAHTAPSHLSLLTGVYPYEHGVLTNSNLFRPGRDGTGAKKDTMVGDRFAASAGLNTFTALVRDIGYGTGGFVSASPLKRVTGVAHGFETWSEPEGARRTGEETSGDLLPWLDEQPTDRPYFLWAHLFDAHGPYEAKTQPPEPYDTMFPRGEHLEEYLAARDFPETVEGRHTPRTAPAHIVDLYDGSVRWMDDQLRPILERLYARPDWERTVVIVVGDHGQGLGQHDYLAHGTVWQEQLHVPLLKRIPGQEPRRIDDLMSIVDILATAAGAADGFPVEAFLAQSQGIDVLAADAETRPVFAMSPPRRGMEAITDGRWKYVNILDGEPELYDLASDPYELVNVASENPAEAARMAELLSSMTEGQHTRGAVNRSLRSSDPAAAPDDDFLEELDALGYGGDDEEE